MRRSRENFWEVQKFLKQGAQNDCLPWGATYPCYATAHKEIKSYKARLL